MIPDFVTFMQRLELLAFFAGYPLLFTFVYFGSQFRLARTIGLKARHPDTMRAGRRIPSMFALLPAAYGLTAGFFLIRQVFNSNDPSIPSIIALKIWGCLALLFWLPTLQRNVFLSFLHGLVFFGLIVIDIFTGLSTASGRDQISNDMKILTDSLLLNTASLAITVAAVFIKSCIRHAFNR
jgi:hypothetical protein